MTASRLVIAFVLTAITPFAVAQSPSPYVTERSREIKSLSAEEVADYLAGKGMGLAKAAELNGYPGPAHVLELAAPLRLTTDQKAKTEALFRRMQSRASTLGRNLVDEERALDMAFAEHAVSPESLERSLARIGRLQGELRQVHLAAHLEQVALLTPEQIRQYGELRGYSASSQGDHGHKHH